MKKSISHENVIVVNAAKPLMIKNKIDFIHIRLPF